MQFFGISGDGIMVKTETKANTQFSLVGHILAPQHQILQDASLQMTDSPIYIDAVS
jgi:hypothetical protein